MTVSGDGPRSGALHLAASWLTVVPVPQPRTTPDARDGARVIAVLPVLGLILGTATAAIAFGLGFTDIPHLVIGTLCVAILALITRGMHLDGLADTADGLGCYGDPERVRTVMRAGDVGPFGAATLALSLLLQSASIGALADGQRWFAIAFAVFLGRVAVVLACRRALPAAAPQGFGALVAATQRTSIAVWLSVAAALAVGSGWLDPLAADFAVSAAVRAGVVLVAVAVFAYAFTRHCARRADGISGDVLGATLELSTTIGLVLLLL